MEIGETLDKWFNSTFTSYQENVHPPRESDQLIMGVLQYARHYSTAVFTLLKQEAKLSTMALLRVYIELYIKLCWCLIRDRDSKKSHQDQVYDRFKWWDYQRLLEQKKHLNKLLEITNDESSATIHRAKEQIDRCKLEYTRQKVQCIPSIWHMLKELSKTEAFRDSPDEALKLYTNVYQPFCQAVHPNMDIVRQMVANTGDAYIYYCDVKEDAKKLLLMLISMSSDINRMTRDFYGWDSSEMQTEYSKICQQLNNNSIKCHLIE